MCQKTKNTKLTKLTSDRHFAILFFFFSPGTIKKEKFGKLFPIYQLCQQKSLDKWTASEHFPSDYFQLALQMLRSTSSIDVSGYSVVSSSTPAYNAAIINSSVIYSFVWNRQVGTTGNFTLIT